MYFVSFCSRFIDRFAPCVLFRRAMWEHQFTVTLTCTNANETVAIDVLVVVYNKTWENRVMLTLHGQLVLDTVNQQILAAIKFGVSQNKAIYINLAAIKFGVSPRPVYAVYDRRICWRRQILAKRRNSPNSPNIIARQNLLIYSIRPRC